MFVVDARSRATSSGLRTPGRARLTDRHDRVGKIAALQRDLEEEAQRAGTGVEGRYRRSDRPQVQLVAMDILRSGLVERPAHEICEAFNVADIPVLSVGAKPTDRHVLDQSPAQRADGLVGHGGSCLEGGSRPLNLKTGRPLLLLHRSPPTTARAV